MATTPASSGRRRGRRAPTGRHGDAFGTYYNPSPTLNSQYDANGYSTRSTCPSAPGPPSVDLYDPTFCAVDDQKGTGDHWIPGTRAAWPAVSTYYTLWSDPASTPLDYTDDVGRRLDGHVVREQAAGRQERPRTAKNRRAGRRRSAFCRACPTAPADTYHNQLVDVHDRDDARHLPAPGHDHETRPTRTTRRTPAPRTCGPSGRSAATRRYKAVRLRPRQRCSSTPTCQRHDALLPRPDRGGPRRQDDGHPAVRPGRRLGQLEHRGPQADHDRVHAGDLQLHGRLQRDRIAAAART